MDEARFIAEMATGPMGRMLAALWGALWGSFFNVVIARLPEGESLVRPASHCRGCGASIRWYDNVPVVSYLLLRGRCRRCGARYSARYLLVELLVAVLAFLVHHVYVVSAPAPMSLRLAQFFIGSLFCGLLVAIAFIDLDTGLIHNVITYPGIPVAVLLSTFMGPTHLWDGAVGAAGGYLVIRLLADGYRLIRGRLGMGYGDAKLLALIAGLLGWQSLLPVLFLASMQGSLIGISALLWVRRGRTRRGDQAAPSTANGDSAAPSTANGDSAAPSTANGDSAAPSTVNGDSAAPSTANGDSAGDAEGHDPTGALTPLRFASMPFGPFLGLAGIEVLLLRAWLAGLLPMFE